MNLKPEVRNYIYSVLIADNAMYNNSSFPLTFCATHIGFHDIYFYVVYQEMVYWYDFLFNRSRVTVIQQYSF